MQILGTVLFVVLLIVGFAYLIRKASRDFPEYCENCGRNTTGLSGSCACPDCGYRD